MDKSNQGKHARNRKKRLVSKRKIRNIIGIALLAVLVVGIAAYLFIDSRSYVATVSGNRVMTYEYKFLLKQQISTVEQNEGLTDKTQAEKDQYWTKTENGQNPLEAAKNETLNSVKEYEIQLTKANQMGLKVDSNIKGYADQYLKSLQSQYGLADKAFDSFIKEKTGATVDELRTITEKLYLIDKFRSQYVKSNYTPEAITDEQVKNEYNADPKKYDKVDFSYVILAKFDSSGAALPQNVLDQKKTLANEALKKIQTGEDMSAIFKNYSEMPLPNDQNGTGKATLGYATGMDANVQPLLDYLFNNVIGSSSIVETDKYLYVVRIDKHTGFDDVKDTVKSTMESSKEADWYSKQLHQWDLDPQYNILKNDSVYDSISYK